MTMKKTVLLMTFMFESILTFGAITSITDNGLVYEFDVYDDKLVLVLAGYTDDMRSEVTVPRLISYNKHWQACI